MAIYVCSVKGISRGQGRTVVSAAAYRAAEKLYSEYTGKTVDYTRKGYVMYSEIMLPEGAPPEWKDREKLWNSVEMAEKSPYARLATEIMVALPIELSETEQIELVRKYASVFSQQGMCVDVNIHNPPVRDDLGRALDESGKPTTDMDRMQFNNPHAHIMLTIRPVKDGKFSPQRTIGEYICRIPFTDEIKVMTQQELQSQTGKWQKQYRYATPDGERWMTPEEAKKEGVERLNRSPLKTRHGRASKEIEYWTSPQFVKDIRKSWETTANIALERAGQNIRIDSRSYEAQGSEKIPQYHMGPQVMQIERRNLRYLREGRNAAQIVHTAIADINHEIRKHNHMLDVFLKREQEARSIDDRAERIAQELEVARKQWISERYHRRVLQKQLEELELKTETLRNRLDEYDSVTARIQQNIDKAKTEQEGLRLQLRGRISKRERIQLEAEIKSKEALIRTGEHMITQLMEDYGFQDSDSLRDERIELSRAEKFIRDKEKELNSSGQAEQRAKEKYKGLNSRVPVTITKKVQEYRRNMRTVDRDKDKLQIAGAFADLMLETIIEVEREVKEIQWQEQKQ